MAEDRRRLIELELASWREARRRGDKAEPGSAEDIQAEAEAERHRLAFDRLTREAREDQDLQERSEPASSRRVDRLPG